MSDFLRLYPQTAARFDVSVHGFNELCASWGDHGWRVSIEAYALADALMIYAASWTQPSNIFHSGRFIYKLSKFQRELDFMARRTTQQKKQARAKWQGFLDYRLTEDQLMELDEWQPSPAEVWEQADALITSNYRVTLSYNEQTRTATATLIDDDPNRKAGGWALASSDANCALALKAALYKHFLVLQGSWENLLDLPNQGGRRG